MTIIGGNLLPGETPLDDLSGLKLSGVKTRKDLSAAEANNIRKVLIKYFAQTPTKELAVFDLTWAKELHREMFGEVWVWAGELRTCDLNIGCPWIQTQERLYNLLEDLKVWEEHKHDLIEQSARLHHVAVQIHPFPNGNGRWSRMLANIWLALHGSSPVMWPEDTIGGTSPIRGSYIAALQAADSRNIEPLIALHRQFAVTPPRPLVVPAHAPNVPTKATITQTRATDRPNEQ